MHRQWHWKNSRVNCTFPCSLSGITSAGRLYGTTLAESKWRPKYRDVKLQLKYYYLSSRGKCLRKDQNLSDLS